MLCLVGVKDFPLSLSYGQSLTHAISEGTKPTKSDAHSSQSRKLHNHAAAAPAPFIQCREVLMEACLDLIIQAVVEALHL